MEQETAVCSLEHILATFELILEDMMKEHKASTDYPMVFHTRTEVLYLQALDLIYDSLRSLKKEMDRDG